MSSPSPSGVPRDGTLPVGGFDLGHHQDDAAARVTGLSVSRVSLGPKGCQGRSIPSLWSARWRKNSSTGIRGNPARRRQRIPPYTHWMPATLSSAVAFTATAGSDSRSGSMRRIRPAAGSEASSGLASSGINPSLVTALVHDGTRESKQPDHRLGRRIRLFPEPSPREGGQRSLHHLTGLRALSMGRCDDLMGGRSARSRMGSMHRPTRRRSLSSQQPTGIESHGKKDDSPALDEGEVVGGGVQPSGLVSSSGMQHDSEQRRADLILECVTALVARVHESCSRQIRPDQVATSAVQGWGLLTLKRLIEAKLAECGLLRTYV